MVTDPADYAAIGQELQASGGSLTPARRFALAQKAFSHTAAYDGAISNYLTALEPHGGHALFPGRLNLQFDKVQDLRYGENPHQHAAFYRDVTPVPGGLAGYVQLQGKELSYNNIADADAAWECVKTLDAPACVIVKHANPCGVALAENLLAAYRLAFAADPTSAFGGVIAFNRVLDAAAVQAVIAAVRGSHHRARSRPGGEGGDCAEGERARARGAPRSGRESIRPEARRGRRFGPDAGFEERRRRRAEGGDAEDAQPETGAGTLCSPGASQSSSSPTPSCLPSTVRRVGVGAGQMSRVDSARIALIKARNAGLGLSGSVVASDAFFPFRDAVDVVAEAGATAIIQPGGSVRDEEVIAAADEHGMAMVFTGIRHFRH